MSVHTCNSNLGIFDLNTSLQVSILGDELRDRDANLVLVGPGVNTLGGQLSKSLGSVLLVLLQTREEKCKTKRRGKKMWPEKKVCGSNTYSGVEALLIYSLLLRSIGGLLSLLLLLSFLLSGFGESLLLAMTTNKPSPKNLQLSQIYLQEIHTSCSTSSPQWEQQGQYCYCWGRS